jgi:glycosyltransferase involved in cell wall biosynthesis
MASDIPIGKHDRMVDSNLTTGDRKKPVKQNRSQIGYWVYNYSPQWEASSRELETLLTAFKQRFEVSVISQNLHNKRIAIRGKNKAFPFPLSLFALPFFGKMASSFQINHIFSSLVEPILIPRISHLNTIATITKDADSLTKFEKNIKHFKKLRYVVVESSRHREILKQTGIDEKAIKLIYPGTRLKTYERAPFPFKILFATSPLGNFGLLSRGIYLLMQAAAMLPDVRFLLVWRDKNYRKLSTLINHHRLHNVEVLNGYIPDMERIYKSVHATILPGLTHSSLKPCPHSAIDSLSHGKPVLVSQPTSIAGIVSRYKCGVTFDFSVESLVANVKLLIHNYDEFQSNCHRIVEENFSKDVYIESYRKLYETMLQERPHA